MNTRFAPFRLFFFVVLGVVTMGDLNHAADAELSNNIELHMKEGDIVDSSQKRNLRAVDNPVVSESIFSSWMRKLMDTSCTVTEPCEDLTERACNDSDDCKWSQNKDKCIEPPRECEDIKKKDNCDKRDKCKWNKNKDKCIEPRECEDIKKKDNCGNRDKCKWSKKHEKCFEPRECEDIKKEDNCDKRDKCKWMADGCFLK